MLPVTVFDFANATPSAADRFISDLGSDELDELCFDLLQMYSYSAYRLLSQLGWMATCSALHEIREHADDWNERHAAALILAHQMLCAEKYVEADLRQFGAEALAEKLDIVSVLGHMVPVISAIPRIWNRLLPQLRTPGGQDLLQHMATEELQDEDFGHRGV
jgi:hypothetical protein